MWQLWLFVAWAEFVLKGSTLQRVAGRLSFTWMLWIALIRQLICQASSLNGKVFYCEHAAKTASSSKRRRECSSIGNVTFTCFANWKGERYFATNSIDCLYSTAGIFAHREGQPTSRMRSTLQRGSSLSLERAVIFIIGTNECQHGSQLSQKNSSSCQQSTHSHPLARCHVVTSYRTVSWGMSSEMAYCSMRWFIDRLDVFMLYHRVKHRSDRSRTWSPSLTNLIWRRFFNMSHYRWMRKQRTCHFRCQLRIGLDRSFVDSWIKVAQERPRSSMPLKSLQNDFSANQKHVC